MVFEGIGFVSSFDRPSLQWHQRGVDRLISVPSPQTRILVVDDSALMRRSLRTLLDAHDNWKVCDEASNGREALLKFSEDKFDVVVLDFQMPVMDGLEAARQITQRSPATPILMVTMHASSPQLVDAARKVGIRGVCAKSDVACVIEALAAVLVNQAYFPN